MGVVLRAWDDARGCFVALKVIDPGVADPEVVVRLAREADAGAALDHPGIVRPLEAGVAGGRAFIAFELVEGSALGPLLPPAGGLDVQGAVRALRDVARGLAHAHARGVVHRDVKPGNILVDRQGSGRLIDFGLARLVHDRSRLTATGTILGTPGYMSPEQALGERAGPPSDAWGLGAVLCVVLCGRPPFGGASTLATLRAIIEEPPLRPSKAAPASASRARRTTTSGSATPGSMTFRATKPPRASSQARSTTPMPPRPSSSRSTKRPSRRPAARACSTATGDPAVMARPRRARGP